MSRSFGARPGTCSGGAVGNAGAKSSKTRNLNETRLAAALLEWAAGEMGYSGGEEGLPSSEEMRLLASGDLAKLWEYTMGHIKCASNAEVIRGNAYLHSEQSADHALGAGQLAERAIFREQRRHLTRELSSLKVAVKQMDKDISQTREKIQQLETANSRVRGEVLQLTRSHALLSAHAAHCHEVENIVQEFARRIRGRINVLRPATREASYCSRQEGGNPGSKAPALESTCTREVRAICSHLEHVLSSDDGGQSSDATERTREKCWSQIESLLGWYSPTQILSSLVEVTQQATGGLQSDTDQVDLQRDAQQLKYSYDSAGVQDVSEEPSLIGAVEEQLLEAQLSHIQRSVESERAQAGAREARKKTVPLLTQATQWIQQQYQGDTEGLELAKVNLRLELECAGSAASLERLSDLCSTLSSARDWRRQALEQLHNKHRRIQEFTHVADMKQRRIQTLVAHNSAAKDRLTTQAVELQVYVEQHVLSHRAPLHAKASLLQDGISHEVRLFTHLSLDRIHKPPSLDVPVCDLSIHRLRTIQLSGQPSWNTILQYLSMHSYSSPELVIPKLLEVKEKVNKMDRSVAAVKDMVERMKAAAEDKPISQSVLNACSDYDQDLVASGVPALQRCLSLASRGMADCKKTEDTLEHWWAQPGQHLTPWITQEGLSASKWLDQWRVLASKLAGLLEQ